MKEQQLNNGLATIMYPLELPCLLALIIAVSPRLNRVLQPIWHLRDRCEELRRHVPVWCQWNKKQLLRGPHPQPCPARRWSGIGLRNRHRPVPTGPLLQVGICPDTGGFIIQFNLDFYQFELILRGFDSLQADLDSETHYQVAAVFPHPSNNNID